MENRFTFVTISTSFLLGILVFVSAPKVPEATHVTYDTTSNIIFRWGVSGAVNMNELDTVQGYFIKDMVNKAPVRTSLDLSQDELDAIFQKMVDMDFFSYPRGFNPTLEGEVIGVPSHFSNYYLEFRNESGKKIVQWSSRYWAPNDIRYQNLFELSGLIQDIIEAKPEYQRLPEPTGGYA